MSVPSVGEHSGRFRTITDFHKELRPLTFTTGAQRGGWKYRGFIIGGPLRYDASKYSGDPFADFRENQTGPNLFTYPRRADGVFAPDGYAGSFVFTKDGASILASLIRITTNNFFQDGKGGAVAGADIVPIRNETSGGVLFAASSSPGWEQPGMALTAVKSGSANRQYVPTPKKDWLASVGLSQAAQPQIWISDLDIDPLSTVGWHLSGARPKDDPNATDHGTPAFPYGVIVRDLGKGKAPAMSISSSEGHDPNMLPDIKYGLMIAVRPKGAGKGSENIVAALVTGDAKSSCAKSFGWAGDGFHAERNKQGGVSVIYGGDAKQYRGKEFVLVLKPQAEVQAYISRMTASGEGKTATGEHVGVRTPSDAYAQTRSQFFHI